MGLYFGGQTLATGGVLLLTKRRLMVAIRARKKSLTRYWPLFQVLRNRAHGMVRLIILI